MFIDLVIFKLENDNLSGKVNEKENKIWCKNKILLLNYFKKFNIFCTKRKNEI